MGRTVAELRSSMSWREFREWAAYYQIEPFGDSFADLRNALLRKDLACMFNDKARREPITEYMACPDKSAPRPVMTNDEMRANFLVGMATHNAAVKAAKQPKFPATNGNRKP